MLKWLEGKKTYILCAITVLIGVAELAGIDVVPGVDKSSALGYIWAAIAATFLRNGIATTAK